MQDVGATVISQYSSSPTIRSLVDSINQWLDPSANIDDFYNLVWNVDTAQGYGLDVWGRIVGVGRVLKITTGGMYFGFAEATTLSADDWGPGGLSPFYNGENLYTNAVLDDTGFRTLILAKAFANICDGSIPSINRVLMTLFGASGNVYVIDGGDMTMKIAFTFRPTVLQQAIVEQSGVLPRPAGVASSLVLV